MNRFAEVKTLGQLYNVFTSEDVLDYSNLTPEELERIADIFEANIPDKISMPDRPLTEAGYELIWNVTVETVEAFINKTTEAINNKNNNMEEEIMNESINNTAATTEEVTMGEKAKAFAEASKEKLAEGFEYIVNNVEEVKEEVVKMANMPSDKLEDYLKDSGKDVLNNIINAVKKYSKSMKDNSDLFPSLKENAIKSDNIIELIKDVLDEEELNGWGKFKAIVKEIAMWLVRLFLKVGAIVLKLAFIIVVGGVKIGATALVAGGKAVSVLNREVIKPAIETGKTVWNNHKINKAKRKAEKEADDFEFEDDDFIDEIKEVIFE